MSTNKQPIFFCASSAGINTNNNSILADHNQNKLTTKTWASAAQTKTVRPQSKPKTVRPQLKPKPVRPQPVRSHSKHKPVRSRSFRIQNNDFPTTMILVGAKEYHLIRRTGQVGSFSKGCTWDGISVLIKKKIPTESGYMYATLSKNTKKCNLKFVASDLFSSEAKLRTHVHDNLGILPTDSLDIKKFLCSICTKNMSFECIRNIVNSHDSVDDMFKDYTQQKKASKNISLNAVSKSVNSALKKGSLLQKCIQTNTLFELKKVARVFGNPNLLLPQGTQVTIPGGDKNRTCVMKLFLTDPTTIEKLCKPLIEEDSSFKSKLPGRLGNEMARNFIGDKFTSEMVDGLKLPWLKENFNYFRETIVLVLGKTGKKTKEQDLLKNEGKDGFKHMLKTRLELEGNDLFLKQITCPYTNKEKEKQKKIIKDLDIDALMNNRTFVSKLSLYLEENDTDSKETGVSFESIVESNLKKGIKGDVDGLTIDVSLKTLKIFLNIIYPNTCKAMRYMHYLNQSNSIKFVIKRNIAVKILVGTVGELMLAIALKWSDAEFEENRSMFINMLQDKLDAMTIRYNGELNWNTLCSVARFISKNAHCGGQNNLRNTTDMNNPVESLLCQMVKVMNNPRSSRAGIYSNNTTPFVVANKVTLNSSEKRIGYIVLNWFKNKTEVSKRRKRFSEVNENGKLKEIHQLYNKFRALLNSENRMLSSGLPKKWEEIETRTFAEKFSNLDNEIETKWMDYKKTMDATLFSELAPENELLSFGKYEFEMMDSSKMHRFRRDIREFFFNNPEREAYDERLMEYVDRLRKEDRPLPDTSLLSKHVVEKFHKRWDAEKAIEVRDLNVDKKEVTHMVSDDHHCNEILEAKTYGERLGLTTKDPKALKKAYREKQMYVHPDKNNDAHATVASSLINDAHDKIKTGLVDLNTPCPAIVGKRNTKSVGMTWAELTERNSSSQNQKREVNRGKRRRKLEENKRREQIIKSKRTKEKNGLDVEVNRLMNKYGLPDCDYGMMLDAVENYPETFDIVRQCSSFEQAYNLTTNRYC